LAAPRCAPAINHASTRWFAKYWRSTPTCRCFDVQKMTDTIGLSRYAARMGAWLLAVCGGLALLLAAVGIHGVLPFSISRGTGEGGIRLAPGAETRNVFLLVVAEGMVLVGAGIAIGHSPSRPWPSWPA